MNRRLQAWHRWQDRARVALHDSLSHRIMGARIFHHDIWAVSANALAGGLSLGLFVAFTPTIPFQMLLCAVGAVVLRVNLPIALAACWITNPLTAVPIYLYAYRIGRQVLAETWIARFTIDVFEFTTRTGRFIEQSLYLWAGCLMISTITAVLGNVAIRLLATWLRWLKLHVPRQRPDAD